MLSEKSAIREQMLEMRSHMAPRYKRNYDHEVCEALKKITLDRQPEIIHSYLPIKGEIDVTPFLKWALETGFRIVCPKVLTERQMQNIELFNFDNFDIGPFNTIHPAGNNIYEGTIDLAIVPGLAFDKELNRLGYGGGYYDRFLPKYPKAYKLALQYPFQLISSVPTEEHDVKVDQLIATHLEL